MDRPPSGVHLGRPPMKAKRVEISHTIDQTQVQTVRTLFLEYAQSLGFSLCFQGFDRELAGLPGSYAPPAGRLLLATVDSQAAGCVGLHPLDQAIGGGSQAARPPGANEEVEHQVLRRCATPGAGTAPVLPDAYHTPDRRTGKCLQAFDKRFSGPLRTFRSLREGADAWRATICGHGVLQPIPHACALDQVNQVRILEGQLRGPSQPGRDAHDRELPPCFWY